MHQIANRPAGVTIPQGQRSGEEIPERDLPTLSVHNFSKLETWAGRHVDKSGKLVPSFYIRYQGNWYLDPAGPNWFGTLQPLSKEHESNVQTAYERTTRATNTVEVPVEDAVDVMAGEVADESPPDDHVNVMGEAG